MYLFVSEAIKRLLSNTFLLLTHLCQAQSGGVYKGCFTSFKHSINSIQCNTLIKQFYEQLLYEIKK